MIHLTHDPRPSPVHHANSAPLPAPYWRATPDASSSCLARTYVLAATERERLRSSLTTKSPACTPHFVWKTMRSWFVTKAAHRARDSMVGCWLRDNGKKRLMVRKLRSAPRYCV